MYESTLCACVCVTEKESEEEGREGGRECVYV